MNIDNLNRTIDIWLVALESYSLQQLHTKPARDSWSIGQVYMHLLQDTLFYVSQIESCLASTWHLAEEATPAGRQMLQANEFPYEQITGEPSHAMMPQPSGKARLLRELAGIQSELNRLAVQESATANQGKSRHPGLGYFSAGEWFQFADMHFRHHLRQKKRIDHFLEKQRFRN